MRGISTQGTNAIRIAKVEEINGKIYGAASRTVHTNVNGFGKIATIKMKAKSTIISNSSLELSVSNYKAVNATGSPITFNTSSSNITITPTGIEELARYLDVKIFPNPNTGMFTISIDNINAAIELSISDITGRIIFSESKGILKNKYLQEIDYQIIRKEYIS